MTLQTDMFHRLTTFIQELEGHGLNYRISSHRQGAVMVSVAIPGERWEVEFMSEGWTEVEVFRSNGEIKDDSCLAALWALE